MLCTKIAASVQQLANRSSPTWNINSVKYEIIWAMNSSIWVEICDEELF